MDGLNRKMEITGEIISAHEDRGMNGWVDG